MVLPKPTATARAPGAPRHFIDLDGLRGIAVLAVMGYHFGAPFLEGGYLGVDVFFVISGFVVTRNLARLLEQPGWATTFYGRRVSRLYPVLLAFLAALVIRWGVVGDLDADAAVAVVGGLLMSYNIAASFAGAELEGPLILWSLAVEWHFYLLLPLLLLIGRRRITPPVRAVILVGLAAVLAVTRLWALTAGDLNSFDVYLATWFRLDGLLLGSAVALLPPSLFRTLPHRHLINLGVVGTVAAMVIGPHWGARAPITIGLIVPGVGVVIMALVMSAVGRDSEPVSGSLTAVLRWRPVLWAGQRSYSLYLWHYFVGVTLVGQGSEAWQGPLVFPVQIAVSLVMAEISYRLIEQPARTVINRRLAAQ